MKKDERLKCPKCGKKMPLGVWGYKCSRDGLYYCSIKCMAVKHNVPRVNA